MTSTFSSAFAACAAAAMLLGLAAGGADAQRISDKVDRSYKGKPDTPLGDAQRQELRSRVRLQGDPGPVSGGGGPGGEAPSNVRPPAAPGAGPAGNADTLRERVRRQGFN